MKENLGIERIEDLKNEYEDLGQRVYKLYQERKKDGEIIFCSDWYKTNIQPLTKRQDEIMSLIKKINNYNIKVGDGVTVCYYTDRHAYTVIKRTKCTVTIQRDIATLDKNFKPQFIGGGFTGHCINQDEQTYTYEPNPNGFKMVFRWSEKYGQFRNKSLKLIKGRREFFDYNF